MARLLFLAVVVRVVFYKLFFTNNWNVFMLQKFDDRALAVASGQVVESFAAWGTYPLFLGLFYKILSFFSLLDYRIEILFWVNQTLSLISVVLWYQIAKSFGAKDKISLGVLSLFCLFNPYFIYLSGMNMSEALYVFLVSIAVYRVSFSPERHSWKSYLFLGALLAVTYSLRNMVVLFAYALPFILVFFSRATKPFSKKGTLVLVYFASYFMTVSVLGMLNASFDKHQQALLSTNRGANLAQNWCEVKVLETKSEKGEFWYSPPDYWKLPLRRSAFFDVPFSQTSFYAKVAAECIVAQPERLLTHLRSLISVFDGPLYPDPANLNQQRALFWSAGFPLLVLFVFICFFVSRTAVSLYLLWAYLGACLIAVFIGNPGESRFLYSIYGPLLIVFSVFVSKSQELKSLGKWLLLSLAISLGFISLPSVGDVVLKQDRDQILNANSNQLQDLLEETLASFDIVKPICESEQELFEECIANTQLCQQEKLIDNYLNEKKSRAITEMELLCRNYYLVQLRNRVGMNLSLDQIQKPSPLPEKGADPIEAIAAQLFHVDLLIGIKRADLVPAGESYLELFYKLRQFQFAHAISKTEPRGQVRRFAESKEPDQQASQIYFWTLNESLKSIYYFEKSNIPVVHPE